MTSKDYKMSKQTKVFLALGKFKDSHERGNFKRLLAKVEDYAKLTPRAVLGKQEKND